jgi:rhodanese-related sulfurtransferase
MNALFRFTVLVLVLVTFVSFVHGEDDSTNTTTGSSSPLFTTLNATEFKSMLDDTIVKWFDVIADVRTLEEYITGHIDGSTLVESLALYNTSDEITTPDALMGCEYCNIVVYCNSGKNATTALEHLIAAGYKGYLYNGLGVSQWTDAGYPLVEDDGSVIPPCTNNATVSEQCELTYLSYTSGNVVPTPTTGGTPQQPVAAPSPSKIGNSPTSDCHQMHMHTIGTTMFLIACIVTAFFIV